MKILLITILITLNIHASVCKLEKKQSMNSYMPMSTYCIDGYKWLYHDVLTQMLEIKSGFRGNAVPVDCNCLNVEPKDNK